MNELSSDNSVDEEDAFVNLDEESKRTVSNVSQMLPTKSSSRYVLVYNVYKKWKEDNKSLLSNSEEDNLIAYFNQLKEKVQPPSLWSTWSMLRKTYNLYNKIDIGEFENLKAMLKECAKGYKPKRALPLTFNQIMKFMTEAPDSQYLSIKVILVFGICGALRCEEITNMKFKDVEDLGDRYLVTIQYNKKFPGQFIIGNLFYDKVKKYISLRPKHKFTDKFFVQYLKGKCVCQTIGKNKIGEVPLLVASYLNLENLKRYTGHSYRRTSEALLSETGSNMKMIKQLGRWRSDIITQSGIDNSIQKEKLIYGGRPTVIESVDLEDFVKEEPDIETINQNSATEYFEEDCTTQTDQDPGFSKAPLQFEFVNVEESSAAKRSHKDGQSKISIQSDCEEAEENVSAHESSLSSSNSDGDSKNTDFEYEIMANESRLTSLKANFKKVNKTNNLKQKYEKLKKMYARSEKLRLMMKKKSRFHYMHLYHRIKKLEDKVQNLERRKDFIR